MAQDPATAPVPQFERTSLSDGARVVLPDGQVATVRLVVGEAEPEPDLGTAIAVCVKAGYQVRKVTS